MLPPYKVIANKLGVAYQNVQKGLKAANGDEFSKGNEFIEKATHTQKG
jgi:hypothetical protein